jgi:hypothetical protein
MEKETPPKDHPGTSTTTTPPSFLEQRFFLFLGWIFFVRGRRGIRDHLRILDVRVPPKPD